MRVVEKLDLTVIEYMVYGFLDDEPPLAALAPNRCITLDSLSKKVAPGVALGFLVTPPRLRESILASVRSGGWTTSGFAFTAAQRLMQDGTISELTRLNEAEGQSSHRWPSPLPDGKHFLFYGRGGPASEQGIYAGSIDSPEPVMVVPAMVMGCYAEANGVGYLLFVREGTLMVQRFDAAKLALSGEAMPLVENILAYPGEVGPTAYSAFSAAAGHLIYRTGDQQTTRLTWYERSGKALQAIGDPAGYHEPSLSKDDTKVLFGRSDGGVPQDIYLQDLSRGNITRLTFDSAPNATSVFSPDESQVLFYSAGIRRTAFIENPRAVREAKNRF